MENNSNLNSSRDNGSDEYNVVIQETFNNTDYSTSDEYLSQPLRFLPNNGSYKSLECSNASEDTVIGPDCSFHSCKDIDPSKINIPIVGYEIMEERARFTVYKLKIENKGSGECWYVFRRYTDFVRLCNKLKSIKSDITKYLPPKKWLGNNFDPIFLEERISGLQTFVNAILRETDLLFRNETQDFFCLNEPPDYLEANEESKAMLEALEETVGVLKQQLLEKNKLINSLQTSLHIKMIENENLKKHFHNFGYEIL